MHWILLNMHCNPVILGYFMHGIWQIGSLLDIILTTSWCKAIQFGDKLDIGIYYDSKGPSTPPPPRFGTPKAYCKNSTRWSGPCRDEEYYTSRKTTHWNQCHEQGWLLRVAVSTVTQCSAMVAGSQQRSNKDSTIGSMSLPGPTVSKPKYRKWHPVCIKLLYTPQHSPLVY